MFAHHWFDTRQRPRIVPRFRQHATRSVLVFLVAVSLLGCGSRSIPGILKIGLVAPFEGQYRATGYDAIYAARLAVREINEAGGIDGWRLELAAYDDRGDRSLAIRTAGDLVIDPDVVAVIGHYRPETSAVAAPVYARGTLAYLEIGGWGYLLRIDVGSQRVPGIPGGLDDPGRG